MGEKEMDPRFLERISYIAMGQRMIMPEGQKSRPRQNSWMNDKPCTAFLDAEMNSRDLARLVHLPDKTFESSPLEVATDGMIRPF